MTYWSTPLFAAAGASDATVDMLVDMVIVLGLCVLFGLIAQQLKQSVLVGYLLAGIVVGGPSSLGFIQDISSFSFMGEVGVALLLFTVGLDLPVDKVRKFGSTALVAGSIQVALTTFAAGGIAVWAGLDFSTAYIVGIAVSLSSTAVVIRVLSDRTETDSTHGLVITGVLIAQDVIVVLVLLVVPLLPGADGVTSSSFGAYAMEFGAAFAKLLGLIVLIVVVERFAMRRLFQSGTLVGARELLALSSLTISLGAIGLCWALALSPALGGFIAGLVMADAAYASHVRSEIAPIRMGLMAIFFAYVGMLADAGWMVENIAVVLAGVFGLIIGKGLLTWVAARIARVPGPSAILTAVGLAQLGEFSFAVLTMGVAVDLVDDETFRLLVSISVVSLLATPGLIAFASNVMQRRMLAAGELFEEEHDSDSEDTQGLSDHAVVIGVGPAGRGVVRALEDADMVVKVIDMNPRADVGYGSTVTKSGCKLVFGDAARPEVLTKASIQNAKLLVVTTPDPTAIRIIIAQARLLAPELRIVARGRYNRFVDELFSAGADYVVDEEDITGRELAAVALRSFVS